MTRNVKSSLPGERDVSREIETKAVIREFRRKDRPVHPRAPTDTVQRAIERGAPGASERQA